MPLQAYRYWNGTISPSSSPEEQLLPVPFYHHRTKAEAMEHLPNCCYSATSLRNGDEQPKLLPKALLGSSLLILSQEELSNSE